MLAVAILGTARGSHTRNSGGFKDFQKMINLLLPKLLTLLLEILKLKKHTHKKTTRRWFFISKKFCYFNK
jgi:hypothetical protein